MRKMILEIPEAGLIDINGDVFEIRASDADILNKCENLRKKYADLLQNNKDSKDSKDKPNNSEAVISAVNETIAAIDDMLVPVDKDGANGESAVKTISKGRPVNMITAFGWLIAICREINQSNDDYINDKYE